MDSHGAYALLGTDYGHLLIVKVALFLVMLSVAAVNRLRFTPCLAHGPGAGGTTSALQQIERNSLLEVSVGAIIIILLVAAISLTKFGHTPPPGIGAVVIIIAKQNGLFQQSGAILGVRIGAPTLGHCERQ